MSITDETIPEPQMLVETVDFSIADRILLLDETIKASPDAFMQSCRQISRLAVEHDQQDGVSLHKSSKQTAKALKQFVEQQDIRYIDFDPDSEEAIFSNSGIINGIAALKKTHGHMLRRGGILQHVENPRSIELKNDLSVFKLFLYAKQVKDWQLKLAAPRSDTL